jgi:hypothetical protein
VRRLAVLLPGLGLVLALPGIAAADHQPPDFGQLPNSSTGQNQGGVDGVEFELVESFFTGNPHTDLDFFSQGGTTYVSVGTLGIGPNNAGQNIFKLTDAEGNVSPDTIEYVAGHPSATCITDESRALGLQHDVEATPKGADVPIQTNRTDEDADASVTGDTQLLLDATDATGRCHDQGGRLGFSQAPQGGLEIIDVTDVENPVEIGLTSHIGQAHTVNVDPRRPHIAYVVTSDAVGVNGEGVRTNELAQTDRLGRPAEDLFTHDGFEIVDLSSCMTAPFGTMPDGLDVAGKREACKPQVWRYRYPTTAMALGHTNKNAVYGCHELETWADDTITCGGGAALIVFDVSEVFAPNAAGFEVPKGAPLPCRVRESSSNVTTTGASVVDCVVGEGDVDLRIRNWLAIGEPGSIGDHVGYLGSVHHQGRQATGGDVTSPAFGAKEDVDFNHEAEFTHSRKFVIATDERGGGVVPPGATCAQNLDNPVGNGGLHAYAVDRLFTTESLDEVPTPEEAFTSYARTPAGDKAIFRAEINTPGAQLTECTAHVFQQLPVDGDGTLGRIFMGWYSQGTQVVDYRENADGTFEFASVGYFIPELANQWVSHVFSSEVLPDGRVSYFGVASDFQLGNGRNSVEVFKATLPPLGAAFDTDEDTDGTNAGGGGGSGGGSGSGSTTPTTAARTLPATGADLGLLTLALVLLPAAVAVRVLRRRLSPAA